MTAERAAWCIAAVSLTGCTALFDWDLASLPRADSSVDASTADVVGSTDLSTTDLPTGDIPAGDLPTSDLPQDDSAAADVGDGAAPDNGCPACGANQDCVTGRCACAPGYVDCDGMAANGCEADLASSERNCGSCRRQCPSSQVCSGGDCVRDCAAGLARCGSSCVDLGASPQHCGACDNACGPGANRCCRGTCMARCN